MAVDMRFQYSVRWPGRSPILYPYQAPATRILSSTQRFPLWPESAFSPGLQTGVRRSYPQWALAQFITVIPGVQYQPPFLYMAVNMRFQDSVRRPLGLTDIISIPSPGDPYTIIHTTFPLSAASASNPGL
jgi:hypothetical protein